MAAGLAGCTAATNVNSSNDTTADKSAATSAVTAVNTSASSAPEISAADKDVGYSESDSVNITLTGDGADIEGEGAEYSDGRLSVTEGGTYVLTGELNGQIYVKAKGSEVKLVLNGVTVTNDSHAALFIDKAEKVTITLNEGTENTLSDGSSYTLEGDDDNTDAALFSRADLTINGEGSLTVNGNYQHGIVTKDSLIVTGGNITVTAVKDTIQAKDGAAIGGGKLDLTAGDDGIHSDGDLSIEGGEINILKSNEGIEGNNITVSGDTVNVTASDDGFNAAGGSDSGNDQRGGFTQGDPSISLTISGGTVNVNADGDGIDSNGNLYITGGTVYVSGPTNGGNGALDYGDQGCTIEISGGTVIAAGSVGMEVGFGETSTQYSVLHNFDSAAAAGSEFTVTDSDGNVIMSFTPEKTYQSVLFSCADLKEGTYTVTAGDTSEEVTVSSVVTSNSTGMGMGGGRGGFRGGDGQMPDGGNGGGFPGGDRPARPGEDNNDNTAV